MPRACCSLMILLAVFLAAGCSPRTPRGGGGPGGREQPLALTPKQEAALGRRAYAEVMKEVGDRVLPDDSPEASRARAVLDRLADAAANDDLQKKLNLRLRGFRFDWRVQVVRSGTVNAFCLPAGQIFLYTGILKVIGRDDDFLATVLSHEMAHALAHHSSERIARASGSMIRRLSYDRFQESEADQIGVYLMAFAGYDPERAEAFWEKMSLVAAGKERRPEFMSSHPSPENRQQALLRWGRQAMAVKREFDRKKARDE